MGYVSRQSSSSALAFRILRKHFPEHPNLPNYAWGAVSKRRSWLAVVFTGSEVSTVLVRVRGFLSIVTTARGKTISFLAYVGVAFPMNTWAIFCNSEMWRCRST